MARREADVDTRTVQQLAQASWQASGLSDAQARRLGFRALSAGQVKNLAAKFHDAGALYIPYFDLSGKRTKFFRLRYLERLPGAAGVTEKPQRYDQLPVMQEAYFPPLLKRAWKELAQDNEVALCITEGEKKAACGCARGIPTLALGGVYSFMSSKRGVDFLPALEQFNWQDRKVFVVYDNDITHKLPVMQAQKALADQLTARGARVFFANLPPGPAKGMDDYIVQFGTNKFQEILDQAEPYAACEALWQLNSEVCFVKQMGAIIERASNTVMRSHEFIHAHYANRHYAEPQEKGNGKNRHIVLVKKPLAPAWIQWEKRAELEKLTYQPGQDKIVAGAWNTWNGWGVKPKRGDISPWIWLLDFLFHDDHVARRFFERWCAYPVQFPGTKMYTACVLWSRIEGLGKSLVGETLRRIYGENGGFVNARELKGSFNDWAKNRQFIIGEEITTGDVRVDRDYLKDLITNPFFRINAKFIPGYTIENKVNFLFLSNHPDAIFLDDRDRRYMVHAINQAAPAPQEKYAWYDAWKEEDGPAHLMQHFLDMDLSKFDPKGRAPETTSKLQMITASKGDIALWVEKLRIDPAFALRPLGERIARECDLFTAEQLTKAFDPAGRIAQSFNSKIALGMLNAGFRYVNDHTPVRTANGLHRLYAVRNQVKWEQATRRELKAHYDQFFGPTQAGVVK